MISHGILNLGSAAVNGIHWRGSGPARILLSCFLFLIWPERFPALWMQRGHRGGCVLRRAFHQYKEVLEKEALILPTSKNSKT